MHSGQTKQLSEKDNEVVNYIRHSKSEAGRLYVPRKEGEAELFVANAALVKEKTSYHGM